MITSISFPIFFFFYDQEWRLSRYPSFLTRSKLKLFHGWIWLASYRYDPLLAVRRSNKVARWNGREEIERELYRVRDKNVGRNTGRWSWRVFAISWFRAGTINKRSRVSFREKKNHEWWKCARLDLSLSIVVDPLDESIFFPWPTAFSRMILKRTYGRG